MAKEQQILNKWIQQKIFLPFQECTIEESEELKKSDSRICFAIKPEKIPLIFLPEQWIFSQWKDAALHCLVTQKELMKDGYSLKDSPVYNIQFHKGTPVHIDHGSVILREKNTPWIAYGQFCRHFLAPLMIMSDAGIHYKFLFHSFPDGFPLDLTWKMLSFRKKISLPAWLHIKIPSRNYPENKNIQTSTPIIEDKKIFHILQHLQETIQQLKLPDENTIWKNYDRDLQHYSDDDFQQKKEFILKCIRTLPDLSCVLDWGCNAGFFSLALHQQVKQVVAVDADFMALEKLYAELRKKEITNIHIVHDSFSRPHPSYGWNQKERTNQLSEITCDLQLFLALYHHIYITDDIPAENIFRKLHFHSNYLIIEFIPAEDEKIKKINQTKNKDLTDYEHQFIKNLTRFFTIRDKLELSNKRILYFAERNNYV
jgi:hypothetical protein